ncbi:MAG TPA: hypothetical protein DCR20_04870, partial [Planctomycetaceae bacterium]|nr:hypothetical protein [Planctomycetaceae bacterium]
MGWLQTQCGRGHILHKQCPIPRENASSAAAVFKKTLDFASPVIGNPRFLIRELRCLCEMCACVPGKCARCCSGELSLWS